MPQSPAAGEHRKARSRSSDGALQRAIARFQIEDLDLDDAIEAAAFRSGSYPHATPMKRKPYEKELEALQIELLKAQEHIAREGERIVVVFEGRDAAGKGGAIRRVTQHLRPRGARVVALPKPSDVEKGQWYFQRYVVEMPTRGEIVMFDRSWYNRAGVERVMGFCTPEETGRFLHEAPQFERILARDGVRLIKMFLTIGREMQLKRLHARYHDPLKRWKLSPIDYEAPRLWDAYSEALDVMLERTDTTEAPWTIIKANDKHRARLAVIRHLLEQIPYPDKRRPLVDNQDRAIVLSAKSFLKRGGEE